MRFILTVILGLLLSTPLNRADAVASIDGVFSSKELGFTFTPPAGLRDLTAALKQANRDQPKDGRTHFTTLLWMASGPDVTAPDWRLLGIETYPRGRDLDKGDDITADFITNESALFGVPVDRQVVRFAGRDFAMSRVEKKQPPLIRHAIGYTTVRKEVFVTFVFGGNSRDKVEKLAESMNTLKFERESR